MTDREIKLNELFMRINRELIRYNVCKIRTREFPYVEYVIKRKNNYFLLSSNHSFKTDYGAINYDVIKIHSLDEFMSMIVRLKNNEFYVVRG